MDEQEPDASEPSKPAAPSPVRADEGVAPRPASPRPPPETRRGLDWFSFFVANLQTGFGPFVSVYLTTEKWTQVDIGLVLTLGGLVGLFGQVPGGALVDSARSKRVVTAAAVAIVGASALLIASSSIFPAILAAWVLHAGASCLITPALNSMSLELVGHGRLSRRLGRNASFASVGNAVAAAGMGAIGYYVSNQAVFLVTAALAVPALLFLFRIPAPVSDSPSPAPSAASPPAAPHASGGQWRSFLTNRALITLTLCVVLFHLANSAILPLLASTLTKRSSGAAHLLIAACIVVPQILVAVLSPTVGSRANLWGRRPLFLIAFATLALRAALLGFVSDPYWLVAVQVLDGISAATLGVVVPTAIADVTRGTQHYALAQGMIGTGLGIGASVSTTLGGYLADSLGSASAFYGLAICAGLGFVLAAVFLPETRPEPERQATAPLDRR